MTAPNSPHVVVDPTRGPRRRRAVLAAVIGSLLLATVVAKAATALVGQNLGERAWRHGDHVAAERWFALASHVNLVERWISPYNLGVVAWSRGEWQDAADLFGDAAEVAPAHAMCRVLLNQSLSLESLGDAQTQQNDEPGAARTYRLAQSVLSRAEGCSASSAQAETPEESPASPSSEPSHQPSTEPSGQPSQQPSGAPSQDPGEGAEQGDGESPEEADGQAEPSEQQQVDAASKRLEDKVADGREQQAPEPDGETAREKADRLAQRTTEGSRQQQEAADDHQPAGQRPTQQGRTW